MRVVYLQHQPINGSLACRGFGSALNGLSRVAQRIYNMLLRLSLSRVAFINHLPISGFRQLWLSPAYKQILQYTKSHRKPASVG